MTLGPVEYLVISFPGNNFDGSIAPAIAELVESGTVRILDLVFVKKDDDGVGTSFEFSELEEASGFVDIDGDADGLLSDDDIALAAEALASNSSALFILWEDCWANELSVAIRNAGGQLLVGERIPYAVVDAALGSIAASATEEASP